MRVTDQKIDTGLSFAMEMPAAERNPESALYTGFDEETATWRVIVRYYGDLRKAVRQIPGAQAIPLYHQYGIVRVAQEHLQALAAMPQIQYMEKPKEVYFSLETGRSTSCINTVQQVRDAGEDAGGLTGTGVLIGIADSGIDVTHPAFRNEDGSTRIWKLWDQSGMPEEAYGLLAPVHYGHGAEWSREQIDQSLQGLWPGRSGPPGDTGTGHGTAVAGVAAGNGRGSQGQRYRGVAPDSPIIFVRLASGSDGFSRTTEVMEAMDYLVREAQALRMPIAVNISYGNNQGAHDGKSLFEGYITELAGVWKNVLVIAAGNEGDARHHARVSLRDDMQKVRFVVGSGERTLSMQLWKQYADVFSVFLESPSGRRVLLRPESSVQSYLLDGARISVFYGMPTPAQVLQEIYLEWMAAEQGQALPEGIWNLWLIPEQVREGTVEMWMPSAERIGLATGFLEPEPDTTITIPATANRILSVGAYHAGRETAAAFSGRGRTADGREAPVIVAPGVDVITAVPGGGYSGRTGTSIAAPFVTGAAALLMEWGITRGRDPYLYGEKVKAYLIRGARMLPGQTEVPDNTLGWGALCVRDSIPETGASKQYSES